MLVGLVPGTDSYVSPGFMGGLGSVDRESLPEYNVGGGGMFLFHLVWYWGLARTAGSAPAQGHTHGSER
ncbi:hypothetical protein GGTG_04965 [Gaeumannomyces tritici R3-111a-1]|uniref:Uncharacterized protein n=1 Tax=Gaeumannomyces tritici (strain R3-111a-1) TaxID=644352 RepID=J3NUK9_GAET3|nr:hypothetical protein GGTG_04965 [Gaeumannomyces tritici R3-111a-1]EJT79882.1 hypothetical protein GGTG_04965 [Gaeumannomyces tritici R3-111a-1]